MRNDTEHSVTCSTLNQWHDFRLKLVCEGILVGIFSGLIVVFYRYLLEKVSNFGTESYSYLLAHKGYIPIAVLILLLVSIFVGYLVKVEPMISGSGIPQVEGVILGRLDMNWIRVIVGKFIGGVLSLGAGLSLGREGPSVQIGACVGQGISKLLKRKPVEEKFLMTSGCSAGLAAAFNAPLAGVMFALEEVHKNFSPLVLLAAMSSALTADFVSKNFFGLKPVLEFHKLQPLALTSYHHLIVLGIILGVCGVLFNSTLMTTLKLYSRKWIPVQLKPVIPFLLAGLLGLLLPQVLGGGHTLILELAGKSFTIRFLMLLLIVKFLFTMISFGSGVPGGIFLPMLAIGALIGSIYGNVAVSIFNMNPDFINNFIILAMAGYFTAVVKAPITGAVLITEMTGSFSHLLSLSIVCIISYLVSDMLGSKPVYEELLQRLLNNNKDVEFTSGEENKLIIEMPVTIGSKLDGELVKNINWPNRCLLVGIKRCGNEIIPKGSTKIYRGDYLVVLADESMSAVVKETLAALSS